MNKFGDMQLSGDVVRTLRTPCYVVNDTAIESNLSILRDVGEKAGARIILALKGFAMWSYAPLVRKYLSGVTASSLNEALLGKKEFKGDVHVYAPAYRDDEIDRITDCADHISFNSVGQWTRLRDRVKKQKPSLKCAVRINPEHSEVKTALYDPSAPYSRLGVTASNFKKGVADLAGIDGLHFHNLCELNSDSLERTLKAVEKKFSFYFDRISWLNMGGGHHITRDDYDRERLIRIIHEFKERYPLDIYLEPGEAIALNTGVLVSRVLDIFDNGKKIAILDTSAAAHMPDTLEMPYRPEIQGAALPGKKRYTYRLGGMTCLAGDVIGDYSFDKPLAVGDALVFGDMAHYTMVKNNTFNGVNLPSLYRFDSRTGKIRHVKSFGYRDYRGRLS